jgi:uracil phosphoribosyltransferase
MRLLAEEALVELVPYQSTLITTPCGEIEGIEPTLDMTKVTAVSIVRSGDCFVEAVREIEPRIAVGKILIQRDESSKEKRAV